MLAIGCMWNRAVCDGSNIGGPVTTAPEQRPAIPSSTTRSQKAQLSMSWLGKGSSLVGRIRSTNRLLDCVVGAAIAVFTWPAANTPISPGIDSSWIIGLQMAARDRLTFPSEIAFTFGPLGFLASPEPYVGWTSSLALVFVGCVHAAACISMFHLIRQGIGRPAAVLPVLGVAFMFPWLAGWSLYGVLVFLASAGAVLRREASPTGSWFAMALGAAIGFGGLGKLNVAMVSAAIAAVAVVATARDWRRSLASFAVASISVFLGLWLLLGQTIGDLPAYVRSAFEFATGYSQVMGMIDPNTNWSSAVAVLAVGILAGLVWQRSGGLPRRDRLVLWVLVGIMVFAAYKAGFTRAGAGVAIFIVTLLAIWPVVVQRTTSWLTAYMPAAGMMAAFLAVMAIPATSLMDPTPRLDAFNREVSTVATGRSSAVAQNIAALRDQYDLPPEAISLLDGETVDIQPWEAAVAYAYPQIHWRPQPVFQAYAAYTSYLDQLNANFLAGPDAPDRMLWLTPSGAPLSIDYRNFWFDSPAAKVQMLCRYMPIAVAPTWQILGRVPNRCGQEVTVSKVAATAGEAVKVPANLPRGILTLRVSGAGKDLLTRLVTLAYETPPWWLSEGKTGYRMPVGTGDDPMVIGSTDDVGYSEVLSLGAPPDTVTVGPDRGAPGFGSPLTLEFEVIPLEQPS